MVYGIVYDPNGKGIMAPMEYTLMVYSPNGKGMVKGYGQKIKKIQYKRYSVNQSQFYGDYMKWTRAILPPVFEEF